MTTYTNRAAYVRSPWQFEVRGSAIAGPKPNQLLVEIAACAVCGTDLKIADRMAKDWQVFGHEVAGVVLAVGDAVSRFRPGDRVALDSSAPCGRCRMCLPTPYGRGRPSLCRSPATYYGSSTMGFAELLLTPHECAVPVPGDMPLDVASLVEPVGVSLDLVRTAEVSPGDHVLVIGPGPLGLGAVCAARRAGAGRVMLAGRSHSQARLQAGLVLGADGIIEVDRAPLSRYDFGERQPNKVLVTAPPAALPEAIATTEYGGIIAYIGIAFGPDAIIQFDADAFHFRKLSLRASHASPGTHAADSIGLLTQVPELGHQLISHRFELEEIGEAMLMARDDRATVKKMVMVNQIGG